MIDRNNKCGYNNHIESCLRKAGEMIKPMSIGIRDAKVQLSKLLKWVQKGREVILTDRGRPVGKIIPIDAGTLSLTDRISKLEAEGIIEQQNEAGVRKLLSPVPLARGIAQKFLREDRERA
jgi:prevent-host-death family protein